MKLYAIGEKNGPTRYWRSTSPGSPGYHSQWPTRAAFLTEKDSKILRGMEMLEECILEKGGKVYSISGMEFLGGHHGKTSVTNGA